MRNTNNNFNRQNRAKYLENNKKSQINAVPLYAFNIANNCMDSNIKSPVPAGGFSGINFTSLQGGIYTNKSDGGDGRSHKSASRPRVPERSAETNGCSHVSSVMNTFDGNQTSDHIISCKYADCLSTNLTERLRPDTQHHSELICLTCGRHQKWLGNPQNEIERSRRQGRIEQLLFLKHRLNDWQIGFLNNILLERKLSPKQSQKLAEIQSKIFGGVQP